LGYQAAIFTVAEGGAHLFFAYSTFAQSLVTKAENITGIGGYVEAAYNLLRRLAPASAQQLNAFVRHERFDTHAAVPAGVTRDDALRRRLTTVGLSYKPTWDTVFKADYQLVRNAAGAGEGEILSLGVGFQF
jgi:hypothetical protein